MMEPTVLPRSEHTISRRDIDPDALKVLYRLREHGYVAYLVGGSVRDLMLARRPKDFDIGTSAHPYEIKKLFRNCWIIGRRFRLAHVKFGTKTIEVATFRRQVADVAAEPGGPAETPDSPAAEQTSAIADNVAFIHRDNSFGTPEEDAFRRDFTVNGMFYDIASFSVIDYVGGLDDLKRRVIRSIGDPNVRFVEDPVRMLRAVVMASRLDFQLDPDVIAAIERHRELIRQASPARMIEEYYKILRSGAAETTFRALAEHRLLEPVTPEIQRGARNQALWDGLAALDAYRRKFEAAPATLRNPVLLGTLLLPLGLMPRQERRAWIEEIDEGPEPGNEAAPRSKPKFRRPPKEPILKIGLLPVARGDTERLRQLLSLQSRIADLESPPRAKRALMHRAPFEEALTWFEIHGQAPAVVEHWKGFIEALGPKALHAPEGEAGVPGEERPAGGRRRRRRRRGGRRGFQRPPDT